MSVGYIYNIYIIYIYIYNIYNIYIIYIIYIHAYIRTYIHIFVQYIFLHTFAYFYICILYNCPCTNLQQLLVTSRTMQRAARLLRFGWASAFS